MNVRHTHTKNDNKKIIKNLKFCQSSHSPLSMMGQIKQLILIIILNIPVGYQISYTSIPIFIPEIFFNSY